MTRRLTSLLAVLFIPLTTSADMDKPFLTSNLNPFVQVQGVPLTRSATIPDAGDTNWELFAEMASSFTERSRTNEAIRLDGETHRLNFSINRGFTDRFSAGIDVRYIRHTGGSLDQFIETWHDVWGLPQGGRDDAAQDQLDFAYAGPGGEQHSLSRSRSGLGEVTLHGAYSLHSTVNTNWAIRGGISIPLGDADDLLGSEAASVFSSIHMTHHQLFSRDSLIFNGSIGIQHLGDGDVISEMQEDWVGFGSAGLAWRVTERISLKTQVDFHTAYYDSNLEELGDFAAQLIVGGTVKVRDTIFIDLSLSEDILTDRSPDVVFQFGLRSHF